MNVRVSLVVIAIGFLTLLAGCAEEDNPARVDEEPEQSEGEKSEEPNDPDYDDALLDLDEWGEFEGPDAEYTINQDSWEESPNQFSMEVSEDPDSDDADVVSVQVHPDDAWPIDQTYSLDTSADEPVKDQVQATIDGDQYVSVDGTLEIESVDKSSITGSMDATMYGVDDESEVEVSGDFQTSWDVRCNIPNNEDAVDDKGRPLVYEADMDFESDYCQDHTKEALVD